MASNSDESVHYVLILNIEKIVKTEIRTSAYNTTGPKEQVHKSQTEVVKLTIRDSDLARLIARGGKHLELVQDEQTEIHQAIGKPRG